MPIKEYQIIIIEIVTTTEETTLLNNQPMGNSRAQEIRCKQGIYRSYQFEQNLSLVYDKIVYLKKNQFLLPTGRAGRKFIRETNILMN